MVPPSVLHESISAKSFSFGHDPSVLGNIITMGYPIIPMSRDAYLMCHGGEINSFIKHYNGQDYFIISAKTSSGNSGSPVINEIGKVIGMVTEELFEKDQFFEKGKLPYYAAIPFTELIRLVDTL